jgi:hypothetical protein
MRSTTRSVLVVIATLAMLPTRAHADEPEEETMVTVEPPAAPADVPRPWPRGKDGPPPARPAREGPRGSGGIAVSAVRGWRNGRGDDAPIAGAHATAAWRYGGHTRFGATIGVQRDAGLLLSKRFEDEVHGSGPSGRLGGVIGWGAPWNDTFIGFMGEAGIAAGVASGTSGKTITTTYASPYGGGWLVLQVPWRLPVRPTAGLGALWTPNIPDSLPVSIMCELGLVWQAW